LPLLWRVVEINASVLVAACLVTIVVFSPRKLGSAAPEEAVVLVVSLVALAAGNLVLLRRALLPLQRLTALARDVDPVRPGQRVPIEGPDSEPGELAAVFNEMLSRLEAERRESTRRALDAQESERLRVARELHDEVGQTLTAVLLQLGPSSSGSPSRCVRSWVRRRRPCAQASRMCGGSLWSSALKRWTTSGSCARSRRCAAD
jgi:two-component system sensor histidine kinase UhpB